MTLSRWWTDSRRAALLVVAVAALVRGLHLATSTGSPFFHEPVVDALTYHNLARDLAAGGPITDRLLWQAPFYPLVLAGLYAVVGPSVVVARILGLVVGAITALVSWRLGRRVCGDGGGLVVGLIVALHGVLVVFDTELLATGWSTLWLVLGVWLLDRLRTRPHVRTAAALGVVLALGLLTRTVILPPLVLGLGWVIWRLDVPLRRRFTLLTGAVGVAGLVLALPVAVLHHHTGHRGLWPPSGAINLYLGNNANIDESLAIRPGLPWEALVAMPVRETGVNDPWRSAAWFRQRTRQFVRHEPGLALRNLGAKFLHLIASRELPRNVDVMQIRPWSPVLSGLMWRAGPWGFPSGVLIPLAVLGLVVARRRLPTVIWLAMAVYALELVLVFTSSRYRAPLWPLAAVAAVAGVQALLIRRDGRRLLTAGVVLVAMLAIGTLPGPFAQEQSDLRAEMWQGLGFNQLGRGDLAHAEKSFRQALTWNERYPEAWCRLGATLAKQERYLESIPCFERAAELAPDYPDPGPNLQLARDRAADQLFRQGHGHQQAGRDREAVLAFERVLALKPDWPEPQGRLALILATTSSDSLHDPHRAVALARKALADLGEEHPWLLEVLATAEAATR